MAISSSDDLRDRPDFPADHVEFGAVIDWKVPLLRKAAARFAKSPSCADRAAFETFCQRHANWLDEFALFMALKEVHNNIMWTQVGPRAALARACGHRAGASSTCATRSKCNKFIQFEFERQWNELKAHCGRNNIRIMGDMPIYVALDSADVWADPRIVRTR